MKYYLWKLECNEENIQMFEVFDEKDLLEVQNEIIKKGFVIEETFKGKNKFYIKAGKFQS